MNLSIFDVLSEKCVWI